MAARGLFSAARSLMRAQDQLLASHVIQPHMARACAYFEVERGVRGLDASPRPATSAAARRPPGQ